MQNKTILITGASSGLGQELAKTLQAQGANLALFSRKQEPMGNALIIKGDTTNPEDCKRAVEQTIQTFGSLDHLLLNAGISMWARFDQVNDPLIFKTIMETNYLGTVYFTHYALPHLQKTNGLITVISSIQGKIPVPYHTGYAASKHALQGFFDSLRAEKLIDVLIVSPGWIRNTGIHNRALIRLKDKGEHGLKLESCAKSIITAMKKRKRELVMPWHYKTLAPLKLLFPKFFDYMVKKQCE